MSLEDPVVWMMIAAVVIFFFGSNKIPAFAKALGEARREFDNAWKGISMQVSSASVPTRPAVPPGVQQGIPPLDNPAPAAPSANTFSPTAGEDPLVVAARNEGIDPVGKSREQIANELAWKLGQK